MNDDNYLTDCPPPVRFILNRGTAQSSTLQGEDSAEFNITGGMDFDAY